MPHSHLTTYSLLTTVPVEERNGQLNLGLSSYGTTSGSPPVLNKSLGSLVASYPGELSTVETHVVPLLSSSPPMTTQTTCPSMDQVMVSSGDHLQTRSLFSESSIPLVSCSSSLSSNQSDVLSKDTTESNDRVAELPEETTMNEEDKDDGVEEEAVVMEEEVVMVEEADEREEEIKLVEEEVVVVVTPKSQPSSIINDKDSDILDAISVSSLTNFSQASSQKEPAPSSPPSASSSHKMSAYLKLVGKCTTKKRSLSSSLTSEGSNLEKDLLEVMEGDTGEGRVESEILVGPSLKESPADNGGDGIGIGEDVTRKSGGVPLHTMVKSGRGKESRKVIVDNTSLKRRMGECLGRGGMFAG